MKKKNVTAPIGSYVADPTLAAMEQMELYRALHPASPAAVRRPRLTSRGDLWIALLGGTWKMASARYACAPIALPIRKSMAR